LQAALSWIRALLRPAKGMRAHPDASAGVSHETHPRLLQARPSAFVMFAAMIGRVWAGAAICVKVLRRARRCNVRQAWSQCTLARMRTPLPSTVTCGGFGLTREARPQEVLGIPKGKDAGLVPSGYPGLAYLPHTPGLVVTLGIRDPGAFPSHLLGCAPRTLPAAPHRVSLLTPGTQGQL